MSEDVTPRARFDAVDWEAAGAELDAHGHVLLASILDTDDARACEGAFGAELYARLRLIADRWAAMVGAPPFAPEARIRATVDARSAGEGRALARDVAPPAPGSHSFPLRATLLLSEPGQDFTGGEMVTVEQRPRMQSRASVIVPSRRGDLVIFAAGARPVRGASGVYRTFTRQALSRVRSGRRVALDVVFT